MPGWIKVYTGPMFSRKTEELLVELHRFQLARRNVVLFKHSIDIRYERDQAVSHDGRKMGAISTSDPADLLEKGKGFDVIGIDEAQFFSIKIVDAVEELADMGKRVVVAGLDKDYLGRPFGPMPQLLAIADEVVKLQAVCTVCGAPATFTVRKVREVSDLIVVGGSEIYEPRCRDHRFS